MIGFPIYKGKGEEAETGSERSPTESETQRAIEYDDGHSYNSSIYKPLYEMSNSYLSNGYYVLYGAETIPNKSAEEKVFKNITNVNPTNEIQNNISRGFLTVLNCDSIYERSGTDYKSLLDFWNLNVERIQKELQQVKAKGTIIFSTPDSYFEHGNHDVFMMFEKKMGKTFHTNTSMICWYKEKWLSSLSIASLIKLLINHKYTVHSDWKYKAWNANEIINLISNGIDKSLGEGSARLLFQTMNTVHKLNHQDIVVSRPVLFETTLKRLLGNDDQYVSHVMDSIFEQIIENISFSREVMLSG